MVALVEGDSFCVESDRLLEVARLARRVALSHLCDHHVNLDSYVVFSKTILAIIVINIIRKDLLNMGSTIFKYIDHVIRKLNPHLFKKERLVGLGGGRRRGHVASRLQ